MHSLPVEAVIFTLESAVKKKRDYSLRNRVTLVEIYSSAEVPTKRAGSEYFFNEILLCNEDVRCCLEVCSVADVYMKLMRNHNEYYMLRLAQRYLGVIHQNSSLKY